MHQSSSPSSQPWQAPPLPSPPSEHPPGYLGGASQNEMRHPLAVTEQIVSPPSASGETSQSLPLDVTQTESSQIPSSVQITFTVQNLGSPSTTSSVSSSPLMIPSVPRVRQITPASAPPPMYVSYLQDNGPESVYVCNVLIVGSRGVGKTKLVNALVKTFGSTRDTKYDTPPPPVSTPGRPISTPTESSSHRMDGRTSMNEQQTDIKKDKTTNEQHSLKEQDKKSLECPPGPPLIGRAVVSAPMMATMEKMNSNSNHNLTTLERSSLPSRYPGRTRDRLFSKSTELAFPLSNNSTLDIRIWDSFVFSDMCEISRTCLERCDMIVGVIDPHNSHTLKDLMVILDKAAVQLSEINSSTAVVPATPSVSDTKIALPSLIIVSSKGDLWKVGESGTISLTELSDSAKILRMAGWDVPYDPLTVSSVLEDGMPELCSKLVRTISSRLAFSSITGVPYSQGVDSSNSQQPQRQNQRGLYQSSQRSSSVGHIPSTNRSYEGTAGTRRGSITGFGSSSSSASTSYNSSRNVYATTGSVSRNPFSSSASPDHRCSTM